MSLLNTEKSSIQSCEKAAKLKVLVTVLNVVVMSVEV
jgi:hypothetical protein